MTKTEYRTIVLIHVHPGLSNHLVKVVQNMFTVDFEMTSMFLVSFVFNFLITVELTLIQLR